LRSVSDRSPAYPNTDHIRRPVQAKWKARPTHSNVASRFGEVSLLSFRAEILRVRRRCGPVESSWVLPLLLILAGGRGGGTGERSRSKRICV
jgi:hypothetical protein